MKFILFLFGALIYNCQTLRLKNGHKKSQFIAQKHRAEDVFDQDKVIIVSLPFVSDSSFSSQSQEKSSSLHHAHDFQFKKHQQIQQTNENVTKIQNITNELKLENEDKVDPNATLELNQFQKDLIALNPPDVKIPQIESQTVEQWAP